jgi:uncharacterized RmlC-like cupin family protein
MRQIVLALTTVAISACSQMPAPSSAWIDGVKYAPMGAATGSGAFSATLDGSTAAAGPYTIRVHITKGGKILPHTHPDARVITVVDGDLCYGFGETFDEKACKIYPEGSYFLVPGNVPHFGVGTSDAVYQESGVGPSAFNLVPAK